MSQRIHLDATPGLFHQVLHCHQGDVGRQFEIAVVTRDGYEIPSGATFKIQATKPSGLGFTVTGTAANNIISFTSTEDMTSEAGEIPTQLEIKSGNDVIYTSNFLLVCEKNTHPASITDGSPEEIISEITLLVERAESAASTAGADAAAAAQARVDEMMNYLPTEVTNLKSDLSNVASSTGSVVDITPTYTDGRFIGSSGWMAESEGFACSDPISVKRGDRVILNAYGYETNVAMIAINHIEGATFYQPLVTSTAESGHYEYVIPVDMEIVVSFNISSFKGLTIIRSTEAEAIDLINNGTSELVELTTTASYINPIAVGTLYNNKHAQLSGSYNKLYFENANENFKCVLIDDLSNVKFIRAYCTIGVDRRYDCGIICTDDNDIVVKAFNRESGETINDTIIFEVPAGTTRIYVNGVFTTPTAESVERTLEFKGAPANIVNEMVDHKSLTYVDGYFITNQGTKVANSDFCYSESFYLKPCHLLIKAIGYLTNVAILSKGKTTDETVTPLIISTDSSYKYYSIDITEEGYYLVCTGKWADAEVIAMPSIYQDASSGDKPYCDLSIFRKFGVVGDSYASGELYYDNNYHDKYFNSWGQVMARKHGTVCTNYSSGGLTTRSWLTASRGLPLLNSSEAEDIYYLALGINDVYALGTSYLGSITDITSHSSYEDYGDTFYGNYGRIIEQIQAHAPHAKIVMFTCASTTGDYPAFNNAIIEIANHYNIPYIVQADDDFFQSTTYTNMAGGHPTSIGYSGMAVAFERLLNKCIVDNLTYFFDLYMYD